MFPSSYYWKTTRVTYRKEIETKRVSKKSAMKKLFYSGCHYYMQPLAQKRLD